MTGRLRTAFREFWFALSTGQDRQEQTMSAVRALLDELEQIRDDGFLAGHGIAPTGGTR